MVITSSQKLVEAAERGDLDTVRSLVTRGADLDHVDARPGQTGETALMWAARFGHKQVAQALVGGGAPLEARDHFGRTALRHAASCGHVDIVRHLIRCGASVEARDHKGWTALMRAAYRGHTAAVTALMQAGGEQRADAASRLAVDNGHRGAVAAIRKAAPTNHFSSAGRPAPPLGNTSTSLAALRKLPAVASSPSSGGMRQAATGAASQHTAPRAAPASGAPLPGGGSSMLPRTQESHEWCEAGKGAGSGEAKPVDATAVMGSWEAGKLLGRGMFSEVRSCQVGGAAAAVKKVTDTAVWRLHPTRAQSVLREITVLRQLARCPHPCIARLWAACLLRGPAGPEVLLCYAPHQTDLQRVINSRMYSLTTVLRRTIIAQVVSAVAWVHEAGLVHRDVKPANILLTWTSKTAARAALCDFGLVRGEGEKAPSAGTVWYRPPEHLSKEAAMAGRGWGRGGDVWAVGCVWGEMLARSPLFPGNDAAHTRALIQRALGPDAGHAQGPPPPPASLACLVAGPLGGSEGAGKANAAELDALSTCLCPDPEHRSSVADLQKGAFLGKTAIEGTAGAAGYGDGGGAAFLDELKQRLRTIARLETAEQLLARLEEECEALVVLNPRML